MGTINLLAEEFYFLLLSLSFESVLFLAATHEHKLSADVRNFLIELCSPAKIIAE